MRCPKRCVLRGLVVGVALAALTLGGCQRSDVQRVVLYCAQDREYAEELLADFTRTTGIAVDLRGDTEANKSVGLTAALLREKEQPRCDVFWNNEPLNTLRLDAAGVLAEYRSPNAVDFPEWTRGPTWQAFAARARVLVVRKEMPAADRPKTLAELTTPAWQGRFTMAKPFFGTTATHSVCLYHALGPEPARKLFTELAERATVLAGNRDVAEAVAAGRFDVGLTDTDDVVVLIRKGHGVEIIYPDQDGEGTLFLPNMLSLIRGAPNAEAGKKLIDFLLHPETERRLAEGPSAQIPLNPKVRAKLEISTPAEVKAWPVDFAAAVREWDAAQAMLRDLFAR
ncbi:MAG TPA: extracellular solute-binding protein [Gemmatales bacterium]|nr:extracellular solute-binding protein [Gemmatales bacterium]HMP58840.1 extracellular solute-binding protein [Gemmatales bacterium]